jgi:hypothetical protein
MILNIIDTICAWFLYVELASLPIMVMYCISSMQTTNWIIGFVVGVIGAWILQGKILKLSRTFIYCITIILTITTLALIYKLSHNL